MGTHKIVAWPLENDPLDLVRQPGRLSCFKMAAGVSVAFSSKNVSAEHFAYRRKRELTTHLGSGTNHQTDLSKDQERESGNHFEISVLLN